jgi:hypothetical protein
MILIGKQASCPSGWIRTQSSGIGSNVPKPKKKVAAKPGEIVEVQTTHPGFKGEIQRAVLISHTEGFGEGRHALLFHPRTKTNGGFIILAHAWLQDDGTYKYGHLKQSEHGFATNLLAANERTLRKILC